MCRRVGVRVEEGLRCGDRRAEESVEEGEGVEAGGQGKVWRQEGGVAMAVLIKGQLAQGHHGPGQYPAWPGTATYLKTPAGNIGYDLMLESHPDIVFWRELWSVGFVECEKALGCV